jgi:hypothetical protein
LTGQQGGKKIPENQALDSTIKHCHHCKKELNLTEKPARGDACPHCASDLRVCLNCRFYDTNSYNDCAEPMAERVVDKDRANFCEYFALGAGGAVASEEEDKLKGLKDLFK